MDKTKSIFYATLQALSDHHVSVDDLFEGDDRKFAHGLLAEYEDVQKQSDTEYEIELYKKIVQDALHKIRKKQEQREFYDDALGWGYVEMSKLNNTEDELWSGSNSDKYGDK
jgi:hypothetical protein